LNIKTYTPKLKSLHTKGRFIHSIGVMQTMSELAKIYSLDQSKAETIGLLHDAAKDLPQEKINLFIKKGHIKIQHECEVDYKNYLHGPVGAYLIQKEFGVIDPEIIDAIYAHTFCDCGRNFNNPLSWCMRFSDLIEPNRDWTKIGWMNEGVKELRKVTFQGQMKAAALLHLNLVTKLLKTNSVTVHPNVYHCIDELSTE